MSASPEPPRLERVEEYVQSRSPCSTFAPFGKNERRCRICAKPLADHLVRDLLAENVDLRAQLTAAQQTIAAYADGAHLLRRELEAAEQHAAALQQQNREFAEVSIATAAKVGTLNDKLAALQAGIAALEPYLQHKSDCALRKPKTFRKGFHLEEQDGELVTIDDTTQIDGPGTDCTCGLADRLLAIRSENT
jgi:hypothetical protein